jgi:hypothetical protein
MESALLLISHERPWRKSPSFTVLDHPLCPFCGRPFGEMACRSNLPEDSDFTPMSVSSTSKHRWNTVGVLYFSATRKWRNWQTRQP